MDIIDISMFRVRVPANLYPLQRGYELRVCRFDEPEIDPTEWFTIPESGDWHVAWKAGLRKGRFFCGKFEERNPFNIPGPFYGAQTDNCDTGPLEAPNNVMLDGDGYEFVFRQPSSAKEISNVISAAIFDPMQGYGADGDEHWNLQLIREWWRGMDDRLAQIENLDVTNKRTDEWLSFSTSQAEDYLQQYAFFVDNRRLPTQTDHLPDI